MTSNYYSIRAENEHRYGTDIGRIGPLLLAHRYGDRTHFIFELLQNAEDALARRERWDGPRAVAFGLSKTELTVSHFGIPFDETDVRSICGIADTTKYLTSIGRFGIGFKSVYAFTDCPEVYSGEESFAIESFVWPKSMPPIPCELGKTVFVLPFRQDDASAASEIEEGLRRIGPRTLLFLKEIAEISWSVTGGSSGMYFRDKVHLCSENARKVVLIGQEHGAGDVTEETWLVFSRAVYADDGAQAGEVEIAFALEAAHEGDQERVRSIDASTLVVFFPTIVPTNLGFLVQGPYRTTPSRDNVPHSDAWNQCLVQETARLLVEALRAFREMGLLDVGALRSLPLDRSKFPQGSMFAPLFEAVLEALASEPLLPCFGGGYVAAGQAKLARSRELRELLNSVQLRDLFEADQDIAWLSEEITQDRTPELRQYLMRELDVAEVEPEGMLPRLTKAFLEAQTDEWVVQLYEFLCGQPALLRRGLLGSIPLVRLEDGTHVRTNENGQPQAFLPSSRPTGFPTVRRAVCTTDEAREFLESLGLTEPDPVDDVIRNVLPKYAADEVHVDDAEYEADIQRMLRAFGTDSKAQREKLVASLRDSKFVRAVDVGDHEHVMAEPRAVYLAAQRLKELFEGVGGVLLVDDSYECLRGEEARELLEACGATRYLRPIPVEPSFTWHELQEIRRNAGLERRTWTGELCDYTLCGLDNLLRIILGLDSSTRAEKARLLWEALGELENRRGASVFLGHYSWGYSHESCSTTFDAEFVRRLNEMAWVPGADGTPHPPGRVLFEDIGWAPNPFLLSKIRFKPPVLEALAREAGIDPGVLDLLKELGVTSEAELRARLGIKEETPDDTRPEVPSEPPSVTPDTKPLTKRPEPPLRPVEEPRELRQRPHTPAEKRRRTFVSYLAVHPDDEGPDPDGLEHEQRMALEEKAVQMILQHEPGLQRMPANTPGFDLVEPGPNGEPVRWVEVKAMTSDLHSRPVGLSRVQFECARDQGDHYWLYVVEHADCPEKARTVRIQDPAGKARTFTFDHGWLGVADIDEVSGGTEEDIISF